MSNFPGAHAAMLIIQRPNHRIGEIAEVLRERIEWLTEFCPTHTIFQNTPEEPSYNDYFAEIIVLPSGHLAVDVRGEYVINFSCSVDAVYYELRWGHHAD